MKEKFIPIKSQKFEVGRVKNLSLCDCKDCDYIHCPKNNYCVKMKSHRYSFDDFWKEWKCKREEMLLKMNEPGLNLYKQCVNELIDSCLDFPKSLSYRIANYHPLLIDLYKFRNNESSLICSISEFDIWPNRIAEYEKFKKDMLDLVREFYKAFRDAGFE